MDSHTHKISGTTKLIGLLGHPISHSQSPAIHNFFFSEHRIDAAYVPFAMKLQDSSQLERFLRSLRASNVLGFNVTLPYKSWAAAITHSSLPAVNTLYREEGSDKWSSTSTDGVGFVEALRRLKVEPGDFERVICIGNGGAGLSVMHHWSAQYPKAELMILRRSNKDKLWEKTLGRSDIKFLPFEADHLKSLCQDKKKTLLVQASSAPVHGDPLQEFADGLESFDGAFIDMVYGYRSALLEKAKELEIPAQNGLPMLIEQARASQKIWFQDSISYEKLESYLIQES